MSCFSWGKIQKQLTGINTNSQLYLMFDGGRKFLVSHHIKKVRG